MNDLIQWNGSLEWESLPRNFQDSLSRINQSRDVMRVTAACQSILIGQEVDFLTRNCPHGKAVELIEKHTGFKKSQCYNFRRVYLEYGQHYLNGENSNRLEFSDSVLGILAQADAPQAALEEANSRKEAGEEVTAKVAREIAAAQKAQQEAEERAKAAEEGKKAVQLQLDQALEAAKPNQERLIRELRLKRKGGGISEAEANALSLLPEDLQRVQYERLRRGESLELDRQAAERTAAQAVEQQQKAMAETQQAKAEVEEMKRKVDELVREGTQGVIDDLNAKVAALEKQVERVRETAWEEGRAAGQKSADEALRQERDELRQQNAALEKEKAAVQRKLTSTEGQVTALASETRVLEARAKGAEEKLEAAHPLAKDNLHAQVLNHMTTDLKAELEKLEADCEPHQRRLSDEAIKGLAFVLDSYFQQNLIIEA